MEQVNGRIAIGDLISSEIISAGVPEHVVGVEDIDQDRWFREGRDEWRAPMIADFPLTAAKLNEAYGPLTVVEVKAV